MSDPSLRTITLDEQLHSKRKGLDINSLTLKAVNALLRLADLFASEPCHLSITCRRRATQTLTLTYHPPHSARSIVHSIPDPSKTVSLIDIETKAISDRSTPLHALKSAIIETMEHSLAFPDTSVDAWMSMPEGSVWHAMCTSVF